MLQTEVLADLVDEIALIAEMEQLLGVDEGHERRRAGGGLRQVEDLQAAALVAGRLHPSCGAGQHLVQHAGGHAGTVLGVHIPDELHQLVDVIACLRGDEDDGSIAHEAEALGVAAALELHGVGLLALHGVPLVDDDDAGLALIVGVAGHLAVLLGEADRCVHEDQGHAAALNSGQRADDHIAFEAVGDVAALAQTGGVGEDELAVGIVHGGVDGITGGARLIGHDHPVLAQNAVGQAGLAHVGAANDGHRDAVFLHDSLAEIEVGADGVQQVAGAVAVDGRNGHDLVKTEVVELVQLHGGVADIVALVDGQNDRLVAAAEHVGNVLVGSGQAVADIRYHDDAVGGVDGDLRLFPHVGQNALGGLRLDAAGVHQQELVAAPLAVGKDAVAGDAGGVLDDGQTLTAEFIEQGGFAHVGAAHHCYDRFAHGGSSFQSFLTLNVFFSKYEGRCGAVHGPRRRRSRAGPPP